MRKLLLLACLAGCFNTAFAQKNKTKKGANDAAQNTLTIPGSAFIKPAADAPAVKFDYKQVNAPLPKFEIINHEQKNITKEVLGASSNLVVMMFNPVCGHCEDQTSMYLKNLSTFPGTNFLLLAAPVQTPNIGYFNANVNFQGHAPRLVISIDSANIIEKLYHYVELPQINIYDSKSLRLVKTFNGFQPIDSLKTYLH